MSLLAELQSLACLVSQRPEVTVHLGESSSGPWSFDWPNARISVNPADYRLRAPDFSRGLLLHESAHAAISCYHAMVPEDMLKDPAVMHLMNVVEDCRIENWLQQRLPGCAPWIALYNNHCFRDILEDADGQMQREAAPAFLLGLLSRWWFGRLPEKLHPLASAAIEEAWPYVAEAVARFPAAMVPDRFAVQAAYSSHPASACFQQYQPDHLNAQVEPDAMTMQARMTQHDMWSIVEKQVLPIFRRLLCASGEEEAFARWAQQRMPGAVQIISSRPSSSQPSGGPRSHLNGPRLRRPGRGVLYAEAVRQQQQEIEQLCDCLLRYLTAEVHLKTLRAQPSGPRLDLRSAMQFEADPRQHTRLWQRQRLPQRPDPHFILLVDVSGSMQGPRAKATFAALVTLREVCLRTGIPLSIVTFGSTAELAQNWEAPTASAIPGVLETVARPSDGSTHLLAALRLTGRLLDESPYREKMLWILSDGQPEDPGACRHLALQLRSRVSRLIGLGLGPDTATLSDIITGAHTGLKPTHLPKLINDLFQHQVRGS